MFIILLLTLYVLSLDSKSIKALDLLTFIGRGGKNLTVSDNDTYDALHLLDALFIGINLLSHGCLVLLEIGEAALESDILLTLGDDSVIVSLRDQLELGEDVRHVV